MQGAPARPAAKADEKVAPKVSDALVLLPPGSVKFSGWLGDEITACKNGRILAQSVPELIAPFAVREEDQFWRSEFWGKWFTSAAMAYRYDADPRLRAKLDEAVTGLINTQTPDGGITTYKPSAEFSNWDTWGRKYTLLGLLAYNELTGDAKALDAARRHADRILGYFGPGKADIATNGWWNGMAPSSILEPMVLLYRRTGDPRYLQFAEYIVGSWAEPKGPDLVNKALAGTPVFKMFPGPDPTKQGYWSGGSSKAYEMMSCYEGLIELYRVTGEPKYLDAARNVFASIRDTEITIIGSGSSWERWCNGRMRQAEPGVPEWMETCVTITWMKLGAQLLRMTGDSRYADEIERSAYNALLAAQTGDGSWWSHYDPLEGRREPAADQCQMHMSCCVANGPRGLMLLPELAVMGGASGPVVNFYEPGTATAPLASGKNVRLDIKSDYPRPGIVEIAVHPGDTENFTLSLRIPDWSRTTKVEVNGQAVAGIQPGTYARLTRVYRRPGDQVRVKFDFTTRLVTDPGGSGRVAVLRGPVVFAIDRRITQPQPGHCRRHGAGRCGGRRCGDRGEARFAVRHVICGWRWTCRSTPDGQHLKLRFCDYASAGQTWSAESTFRVWLPQPLDLNKPF